MPRHSTWPRPDRVRPGQTPQILAARPPGAQLWDLGMEAWASQTGVLSEQGSPSLATGRTGLCVLGWTERVSLEVSRPSDPSAAGAVWHSGQTHCPMHLRLAQKNPPGLHGSPFQPPGFSWYGEGADTRGVSYGAVLEGSVVSLCRQTSVTSRYGGGGSQLTGKPWKLLEGEAPWVTSTH